MPSMYKDKMGFWSKDCSSCKTEYRSYNADREAAYDILRKNFSPRRGARDGLESGCYRCRAVADMRLRFGIDVDAILKAQNNCCMICCREIEFNTGSNVVSSCVDHDHETDEVRGILCRHCNLGLGHFKDNIELLEKAIDYLRGWKSERKLTTTIGRDK